MKADLFSMNGCPDMPNVGPGLQPIPLMLMTHDIIMIMMMLLIIIIIMNTLINVLNPHSWMLHTVAT
jgi:hypothetical protein